MIIFDMILFLIIELRIYDFNDEIPKF